MFLVNFVLSRFFIPSSSPPPSLPNTYTKIHTHTHSLFRYRLSASFFRCIYLTFANILKYHWRCSHRTMFIQQLVFQFFKIECVDEMKLLFKIFFVCAYITCCYYRLCRQTRIPELKKISVFVVCIYVALRSGAKIQLLFFFSKINQNIWIWLCPNKV